MDYVMDSPYPGLPKQSGDFVRQARRRFGRADVAAQASRPPAS